MKVLYILHTTIIGGATISFINLITGLSAKGIEIVVVSPDINDEFKSLTSSLRLKMYKVPVRTSTIRRSDNLLTKFYYYFRMILSRIKHFGDYRQLYNIVKLEKPNIIHTNVGIIHDGYFIAKRCDIPHIWHLREYQDLDFNWRIFPSKHIFCKLLKHSYVISITKDILSHFELHEDKWHRIIYNGIMNKDDVYFSDNKEHYFLCASRVSPEKGHDDVIRAFTIIHKEYPDYRLKILGFGSKTYIDSLKIMAKNLGCISSIDFIGYTTNTFSYMRNAKALVVASKFEGFGRMTAEAYFNGCMVVGRNTGGTKEIFGLTGGVPYVGNFNALAKKMEEVINMPKEVYNQIVKKGQLAAVKFFSNESNVDSIYKFYESIINR